MVSYCVAQHEKWYSEKLKEEMEWEDEVERQVISAENSKDR
jgi:hypothetical protein